MTADSSGSAPEHDKSTTQLDHPFIRSSFVVSDHNQVQQIAALNLPQLFSDPAGRGEAQAHYLNAAKEVGAAIKGFESDPRKSVRQMAEVSAQSAAVLMRDADSALALIAEKPHRRPQRPRPVGAGARRDPAPPRARRRQRLSVRADGRPHPDGRLRRHAAAAVRARHAEIIDLTRDDSLLIHQTRMTVRSLLIDLMHGPHENDR